VQKAFVTKDPFRDGVVGNAWVGLRSDDDHRCGRDLTELLDKINMPDA
jgi:hypothetical protein